VQQDFKVTDSYTAPKGTLIMPSITAATMQVLAIDPPVPMLWALHLWSVPCGSQVQQRGMTRGSAMAHHASNRAPTCIRFSPLQGFTNAERFDPDRFSDARKEDIVHGRNFLTFGFGPHYCVGREYAINHLVRRRPVCLRSAMQ